jgi:carboxylate-amine ligase
MFTVRSPENFDVHLTMIDVLSLSPPRGIAMPDALHNVLAQVAWPLTVERAAALACYLQALCGMLLQREDEPPTEDDYLIYNYNRFQACRFGLDGMFVHPKTNENISLREDILATMRRLAPMAAYLDRQAAFDELYGVAAGGGNHASYLRQQFAEEGGTAGMADASLRCFRQGAMQ